MVNQLYDCASCKQPSAELFFDKRYKHSICRGCFLTRRKQAATALDTEWFLANVPFDQFTENEKEMTGIASLKEYQLAGQRAEPDGTEGQTSAKERGR
jgi:hypothetical protein